ncbi:MAG: hypothetical protein AAGC95_12545 [Pseudomonadota bacterium]
MKRELMGAALALTLSTAVYAEETCTLGAAAPQVPDGATASEDELKAAMQSIKDFQGALSPYRDCLNAIADDADKPLEDREAALQKFNESVDMETAVVEAWTKTVKAFNAKAE